MNLMATLKAPGWRSSPSVMVLVVANVLPLVGVLFFGWEVFPLMLLFWLENLVVGAFNVLKMLTVGTSAAQHLAKILFVPFFCVHYGMFTMVHGVFVFALFGKADSHPRPGLFPGADFVWNQIVTQHLVWAGLALVLSHGFSFVWNYLRGGEYRATTLDKLMAQPYRRVVVLHIAILGGGFLILALGSPTAALALLVLLKIAIDVIAHAKEHALTSKSKQTATP